MIYSQGNEAGKNILSNKQCIFEGNSEGLFTLNGAHDFYSEKNMYLRNTRNVIELVGELGVSGNVVIAGDIISNNTCNTITIIVNELSYIHISDTKFVNNTSGGPIIATSNSANFACIRCTFWQNKVEIEGVVEVSNADQVVLDSLQMQKNNVDLGSMIKLEKSINITVTYSIFHDNYCSELPCPLYIDGSEQVKIKNSSFGIDMSLQKDISLSAKQQVVLDINANYISIENLNLSKIPGFVYRGVSKENLFFRNIYNECPTRHIHSTQLTNANQHVLKFSPYNLENETTVTLQCMQCALHYYRLGVSSLTFIDISDLNDENVNGICPRGGSCSGTSVIALPNYWGFVHNERLYFVFCSLGFCCQPGNCTSYDGCNQGREGKLCTSCKYGYQLTIVNEKCIRTDICVQDWLYGIIVISGLVYIGFLLVKVEIMNIFQEIYFAIVKWYKASKIDNEGDDEPGHPDDRRTKSQLDLASRTNVWEIPFDQVEIFHILVFHLQDTGLFKITLTDMPDSLIQFDEYKENILSVVKLDSLSFGSEFACFLIGWTQLNKLLFKTAIIPFMICVLLFCMLIIKILPFGPNIKHRLMSSAYTVFLLIVIFSSQRLTSYALSFIKCEWLGTGDYLYIDTTVKCYQPWQACVFCYIGLFIFPLWLTLFLGPGLLATGRITVKIFLLGLMFPGPFVMYCLWVHYKERKTPVPLTCPNLTTTAVLHEVYYSFAPFPSESYLCWGGIVEFRRLALVFLAILITDRIIRLMCMIVVVVLAFAVHVKFHPYADQIANTCANLSLFATIMVGIINFGWATIRYVESNLDQGDAIIIGRHLFTFETALIQLFPVGIVLFCIGYLFYVNMFRSKE